MTLWKTSIDLDSDDKDVGKLLKRERDAVFLEIPPLRKLSVCQLMTHERSPQLYLFLNGSIDRQDLQLPVELRVG